jgi:N-acetylmuramoyl-L-alanine amidase
MRSIEWGWPGCVWLRRFRPGWVLAHPAVLSALSVLAVLAAPAAAPAQAPLTPQPPFAVVLDAAHGGNDPGGRINDPGSAPEPEKAVTLALSVRLRSLLAARGIPVVTTRESDTTVGPDRRAEIANQAAAQACLSLHATQSGAGIHLYVSSLAPTAPARFLPWETAQSAWVPRSLALAGALNFALLHAGFTVTLGRTALPAVDSMTCPAVAVEVAPENAPEAVGPGAPGSTNASPADPVYQARVAQALAAALVEWRAEVRQP